MPAGSEPQDARRGVRQRGLVLGRLVLFAVALATAAKGYVDHFDVGILPWWQWVVELVVAAGLLVLATASRCSAPEGVPRRAVRWLCGAGCVFAIGLSLQWVPERGAEPQAAVAVLAAIALALLARWVPMPTHALERVAPFVAAGPPRLVGVGVLLASIAVAMGVAAVPVNDQDHRLGVAVWLGAIAVFATGCWLASRNRPGIDRAAWAEESGPPLDVGVERLLLILVLALGGGLRWFALGDVPTWIDADEGRLTAWGLGLWKSGFPNVFAFGWNSFPHLTYIVHAAGVQILGFGNENVRVASALIGTLSLVPVFFWVRRWWGGVVALVAMTLLAVNQEHLYWSRVGFNNIDAVLVAGLVLASFARALQTARLIDWAWFGVAAGFGFHTYHAAKIFPFLLAAGVVPLALAAPRRLRSRASGAVVAVLALALTIGPQFVSMQRQWSTFSVDTSNRNNVHLVFEAHDAGDVTAVRDHVYRQVVSCLYAFISEPHRMPLLDAATSIPFLAGFLWLAWRWRDPRHVFVFVWIVGILVAGGMMTDYPPSKQRMVGFLPALCLVPAILAGRLRGWLVRLLGHRGDSALAAVLIPWLLVALYGNWSTHFEYQASFLRGDVMTNVCRHIDAMERPFTVYSIGASSATNPRMIEKDCTLAPDPHRIVVNPPADHALVPLPPEHEGGALITLTSPFRSLVGHFRAAYPQARFDTVRGPSGHEDLFLFRLTRPQLQRTRGLLPQYRDGAGQWRLGEAPPAHAPPQFQYRLVAPTAAPPGAEVRWLGRIHVPETGTYELRAGSGRVRVGGAPAEVARPLVEGWHSVEILLMATPPQDAPRLEWRRRTDPQWLPVPRERLSTVAAPAGLLGRYFLEDEPELGAEPWQHVPAQERIESALCFDWRVYDDDAPPEWMAPRPSTMEWIGTVDVGERGDTALRLDTSAPATVYLDGRAVLSLDGSSLGNPVEVVLPFVRGRVPILVRARRPVDDGRLDWRLCLTWRTAGGAWEAAAEYGLPTPAGAPLPIRRVLGDRDDRAGGLPGS